MMAPATTIVKDSILKKDQTDSVVKKVHFKPLPANGVSPYYGLEVYMFGKEVSSPNRCSKKTEKICFEAGNMGTLKMEAPKPDTSTTPPKVEQEKHELEVSPQQDEFEVEAILDHTKVHGLGSIFGDLIRILCMCYVVHDSGQIHDYHDFPPL